MNAKNNIGNNDPKLLKKQVNLTCLTVSSVLNLFFSL